MPSGPPSHFQLWREADQLASAAENALFTQSLLFTGGEGVAPTPEQWAAARGLRDRAKALFQLAMEDIDRRNHTHDTGWIRPAPDSDPSREQGA
jgi:hypothetical protein